MCCRQNGNACYRARDSSRSRHNHPEHTVYKYRRFVFRNVSIAFGGIAQTGIADELVIFSAFSCLPLSFVAVTPWGRGAARGVVLRLQLVRWRSTSFAQIGSSNVQPMVIPPLARGSTFNLGEGMPYSSRQLQISAIVISASGNDQHFTFMLGMAVPPIIPLCTALSFCHENATGTSSEKLNIRTLRAIFVIPAAWSLAHNLQCAGDIVRFPTRRT
jgi:hypothetical protein